MNSPILRHHWPYRRPTTTIYQLTDRLHEGDIAQVPAHQITATVSGCWQNLAPTAHWLTTLPARCGSAIDRQRMPYVSAYPLR